MVGPDKEEFDQALLNLFSYSVTIDSMCLVRSWKTGLLAILMAEVLSQ